MPYLYEQIPMFEVLFASMKSKWCIYEWFILPGFVMGGLANPMGGIPIPGIPMAAAAAN